MAPTPVSKATETAVVGGKRAREGEDKPARPTKTRAVNFLDGNSVIPRKIRTRLSDDPEVAMEEIVTDETRAREAAKAQRELNENTLKEMAATFGRPRFAKRDGQVRFFKGNHPRFTPSEDMFQLLMKDKTAALHMAGLLQKDGSCVWVQAYNTPNPDDLHIKRLKSAISHIADLGIVEGFEAASYEIRPIPEPNGKGNYSPILITCRNVASATLLVSLGHFAFRDATGETAYFTQDAVSYRSAVVIDVKNAPNEPNRLMIGLWKNLHTVIKWKSKDDDAWVPENFQYARVEAPKLAKETIATAHWRIAFIPDVEAYTPSKSQFSHAT